MRISTGKSASVWRGRSSVQSAAFVDDARRENIHTSVSIGMKSNFRSTATCTVSFVTYEPLSRMYGSFTVTLVPPTMIAAAAKAERTAAWRALRQILAHLTAPATSTPSTRAASPKSPPNSIAAAKMSNSSRITARPPM